VGKYALDDKIGRVGLRNKFDTNIVIFDLSASGPTAADVVGALLNDGVRLGAFGERTIRIVCHLGVGPADGELLCALLQGALEGSPDH